MKIKDRVLDFRGLKTLWPASIPVTAIVDEVPSERAGVNLELGEDRWLDLIKLSSL